MSSPINNSHNPFDPRASLSMNDVYPDEHTYTGLFIPSVFELLYILNTKHNDEEFMWAVVENEAIARTDRQAQLFA
uniref:Uncharacterized protein n=1 Tax=Moniliophthora roreri TaxID=221103 RepID=A0A0W0G2Y8_MONRR